MTGPATRGGPGSTLSSPLQTSETYLDLSGGLIQWASASTPSTSIAWIANPRIIWSHIW